MKRLIPKLLLLLAAPSMALALGFDGVDPYPSPVITFTPNIPTNMLRYDPVTGTTVWDRDPYADAQVRSQFSQDIVGQGAAYTQALANHASNTIEYFHRWAADAMARLPTIFVSNSVDANAAAAANRAAAASAMAVVEVEEEMRAIPSIARMGMDGAFDSVAGIKLAYWLPLPLVTFGYNFDTGSIINSPLSYGYSSVPLNTPGFSVLQNLSPTVAQTMYQHVLGQQRYPGLGSAISTDGIGLDFRDVGELESLNYISPSLCIGTQSECERDSSDFLQKTILDSELWARVDELDGKPMLTVDRFGRASFGVELPGGIRILGKGNEDPQLANPARLLMFAPTSRGYDENFLTAINQLPKSEVGTIFGNFVNTVPSSGEFLISMGRAVNFFQSQPGLLKYIEASGGITIEVLPSNQMFEHYASVCTGFVPGYCAGSVAVDRARAFAGVVHGKGFVAVQYGTLWGSIAHELGHVVDYLYIQKVPSLMDQLAIAWQYAQRNPAYGDANGQPAYALNSKGEYVAVLSQIMRDGSTSPAQGGEVTNIDKLRSLDPNGYRLMIDLFGSPYVTGGKF